VSAAGRGDGWARPLGRGLRGHCPRCGAGGLFRRWFRMQPTCPRCGLVFAPGEGSWTGAIVVNFALTGALFAVVLIVLVALTAPDVPVGTLLAVLVPISVIGPLAGYPMSRTLWAAVELVLADRR
jgi:uncharacterized protein (DUF983 family)